MDILIRIKRCALANRIRLTEKARDELDADQLEPDDVRESLMNAVAIYKTIRSRNPRSGKREYPAYHSEPESRWRQHLYEG